MADPMDQPDRSINPAPSEKGRPAGGKISNSLVALSSAAVLTVYAAGYVRTRSAAERFAVEAADLRTAIPLAGAAATAAPPREFVDAVKAAETAPAVPAAPGPKSVINAPPGGTVSPEPSPAPIADSTGAESAKEPAGQVATPTEEPSPAAQTTNAAPADVDTKAAEPPVAPPAARQAQYKDGTYSGWGYSRHGDIQASVSVQDGRIVAAQITQCLTRYSCDVIDTLPSQVISRQNAFVDLISGATESANAFSNAIYRALALSK
jgi:uncharacterized protein with FMN-binding domain